MHRSASPTVSRGSRRSSRPGEDRRVVDVDHRRPAVARKVTAESQRGPGRVLGAANGGAAPPRLASSIAVAGSHIHSFDAVVGQGRRKGARGDEHQTGQAVLSKAGGSRGPTPSSGQWTMYMADAGGLRLRNCSNPASTSRRSWVDVVIAASDQRRSSPTPLLRRTGGGKASLPLLHGCLRFGTPSLSGGASRRCGARWTRLRPRRLRAARWQRRAGSTAVTRSDHALIPSDLEARGPTVAPPPGSVIDGQLAAHRMHEATRQRQAEAKAGGARVHVAESLERAQHVLTPVQAGCQGPRSIMRMVTSPFGPAA